MITGADSRLVITGADSNDPDHDDDYMHQLEIEARNTWDGCIVAREHMVLAPGA